MGYDSNRFVDHVDEELICPICKQVLENPLQSNICEHSFCGACINQWNQSFGNCPMDRIEFDYEDLAPVPRIVKNLLSKLRLKCDYYDNGCQAIVRLENIDSHQAVCEYNPKKPILCTLGCNLIIPKDVIQYHNCTYELRKIVDQQQQNIDDLSNKLTLQTKRLDEYIQKFDRLQEKFDNLQQADENEQSESESDSDHDDSDETYQNINKRFKRSASTVGLFFY